MNFKTCKALALLFILHNVRLQDILLIIIQMINFAITGEAKVFAFGSSLKCFAFAV